MTKERRIGTTLGLSWLQRYSVEGVMELQGVAREPLGHQPVGGRGHRPETEPITRLRPAAADSASLAASDREGRKRVCRSWLPCVACRRAH